MSTVEMSNPAIKVHQITVKKRTGQQVPFYEMRILQAIESAFKAHLGVPQEVSLDDKAAFESKDVSDKVVDWCIRNARDNNHAVIFIEDIQDRVVIQLKEDGYLEIANLYQQYRAEQEKKRHEYDKISIQKRDGRVVSFKPEKIQIAIGKAFAAGSPNGMLSDEDRAVILDIADQVIMHIKTEVESNRTIYIEEIQDLVECQLMEFGHFEVARRYILYRAERRRERLVEEQESLEEAAIETKIQMINEQGVRVSFDLDTVKAMLQEACYGLEDKVSFKELLGQTLKNCYDGIKEQEIEEAALLAARAMIEQEPSYSFVAARILLRQIYSEVSGEKTTIKKMNKSYSQVFKNSLKLAVEHKRLRPDLLDFDLDQLGKAIKPDRDLKFQNIGLRILYDRYFIHHEWRRIETPQIFWMRIAMGLAVNEGELKNQKAIEFYETLSQFLFISSTPTLFNAGTLHPQLSSCFLTTIGDDLEQIFKCIKDNAMLSKWSGGLGNDWTPVRALGSHIKGTNGKSQGIIPFMKVANDTAVAVNQGGKRQGAVCAYLEVWHIDFEDFLELKKNTGDDRRRAHDMHTASWIPDLFMKRVQSNQKWTLFSPNEVPDLHDSYGQSFEKKYIQYEKKAQEGQLKQYKVVTAVELWRKILSMLFETGHPWITFKDPANIRSPQDHQGVIHSTNLCTEIFLNTSEKETAVCNLGSVNLVAHTTPVGLDRELLEKTVKTAIRMLDNVIDINYYPTVEALNANMKHRPVGMGIMGFQDALYAQGISFASNEAIDFADESMELIAYYAILASTELAKEKGVYETYKGSKWDRGILPLDTLKMLKEERGAEYFNVDLSSRLDWNIVRDAIKKNGMRNSNTMAIAPTATIANIIGVTQSIEPTYKNLYVKSNLSGEFTIINAYLIEELKALGLWDRQMIEDLKYFDGALLEIDRINQSIKDRYPTAFEIDYEWIIECASRRQKWIDMGQSLNLFLAEASGKKLNSMYFLAWEKGLKSTYYLRSLGATRIEKSTVDANKYGNSIGQKKKTSTETSPLTSDEAPVCKLNPGGIPDEDCEACQ